MQKSIKNNFRILKTKIHTYLRTTVKASVKFQKDRRNKGAKKPKFKMQKGGEIMSGF